MKNLLPLVFAGCSVLPVLFRRQLRLIITMDGITHTTTEAITTDITTEGITTDIIITGILSEPELGRRRQWACRLLSLLVNGLLGRRANRSLWGERLNGQVGMQLLQRPRRPARRFHSGRK